MAMANTTTVIIIQIIELVSNKTNSKNRQVSSKQKIFIFFEIDGLFLDIIYLNKKIELNSSQFYFENQLMQTTC